MDSFLSRLSLFVAVAFAFPTAMILASWNALPGETLYPVKRGFEAVPRVAFGKTRVAADYEVALTDRRFAEATTLVKRNDAQGLGELETSIKLAQTRVGETRNDAARTKLINNLATYNQQLEQQKGVLVGANPTRQTATSLTVPIQPTPPQPSTTITPSVSNPQPTAGLPTTPPIVSPPAPATVQAIDNTQQIIQTTITELEKEEKEDKDKNRNFKRDMNQNNQDKKDNRDNRGNKR